MGIHLCVRVCVCGGGSTCAGTGCLVGRLTGAQEGRAGKRLREHFQKRGPIYICCRNWFVCAEQGEGGSGERDGVKHWGLRFPGLMSWREIVSNQDGPAGVH